MNRTLIVAALALMISPAALAQTMSWAAHRPQAADPKTPRMAVFPPTEITWKDGPASLSPGARMAVLEGDPTKAGLFTMRLWFPDGFIVLPHWHTQIEHVTVISGTLNVGMGEKFDKAATWAMPAGTFGFWPPRMKHFGWAAGETIIQLHGMGPWTVTYVNAADDPRNRKK